MNNQNKDLDLKEKRIISSNLKTLLHERNLTQTKFAELVGVSKSTMSDYMNLRSRPSHGVLQRMADVLHVNKSDIDTTYRPKTDNRNADLIAAHIDDDVTEEDMKDILKYIDFLKNNHKD